MIKITKKELDKKLEKFSLGENTKHGYAYMTEQEIESIKKWLLKEFEVEVEEPLKVAYMEFRNWSNGGKIDKLYYGIGQHTTLKSTCTRFGKGWQQSEVLEELKKQGWKVENYL